MKSLSDQFINNGEHYTALFITNHHKFIENGSIKTVAEKSPEDHWSCITHLSAEDMLKSAIIEEKRFKHSPWAGTDKPLGPKF